MDVLLPAFVYITHYAFFFLMVSSPIAVHVLVWPPETASPSTATAVALVWLGERVESGLSKF